MNGPDVTEINAPGARRACLVEGCTCKDPRILSSRRASFFACVAKARGETAERVVEPDPTWAFPLFVADLPVELDAAA